MEFKGKYYASNSNAGCSATICLERFYIRISYTDSSGVVKTVQWNTDHIAPMGAGHSLPIILYYGNNNNERIEVNHHTFVEELKRNYPKAAFHQPKGTHRINTTVAALVVVLLLAIGFILFTYLVLIPFASEKIAGKLPKEYEIKLGDAVYGSMVEQAKVDTLKSAFINRFFKELHYPSHYPIRITVVKEEVVNAFALPGGNIVVYEGIINRMEDYEELAALLSHEFSHVQLRHTTKNMVSSLSGYLLISLLVGDAGGLAAVIAENANRIKQLGYSRELEQEADREGIKLMRQSHIDIEGMKHLFEKLKKEEAKAGNMPPAFLSSHPLTDSRIEQVEKELAKNNNKAFYSPTLDSLFYLLKSNGEKE
jgi:predicted Zn-dependent protease